MSETNFPPLPNPGSNGNLLTSNGTIWTSAAPATTFPNVVAITKQKSETGADANVLTYTPPAVVGVYRLHFIADMSADNLAVLGWTATWKDSNGNARAPTNLPIASPDASTTTAAAFTVSDTGAVASTAAGVWPIDTDNSATNIVISFTFSGTSIACKVTAWIERIA